MAPTTRSRFLLISLGFLSLSAAFANVGFPPLLLDVASEFDITVGTAGLAVAAYGLPGIIVVLLAGPLSDAYGRRKFLLGGAAAIGLGTIGCAIAPNFPILLLFRAAAGIGASLCFANILAIVADNVPYGERGRAVATVIGIQTFAAVIGIPVSGLIGDAFGWRPVLLVMTVVSWSSTLFAASVVPASAPATTTGRPYGLYLHVLRSSSALAILAIGFLSGMAWATWASYFVPFLQTSYEATLSFASTLALTTGIGMFAGTQLGGRLGDRLGHGRVLAFALLGAALAFFALGRTGNALALTAALHALLAIASGSRLATHSALISELMPGARSTLMALYAAATSASLTLGTYAGGQIVDRFGFLTLAWCCGAAFLISLPILRMLVRSRHKDQTARETAPATG